MVRCGAPETAKLAWAAGGVSTNPSAGQSGAGDAKPETADLRRIDVDAAWIGFEQTAARWADYGAGDACRQSFRWADSQAISVRINRGAAEGGLGDCARFAEWSAD